jgi:hypothetical protein
MLYKGNESWIEINSNTIVERLCVFSVDIWYVFLGGYYSEIKTTDGLTCLSKRLYTAFVKHTLS